MYYTKAMCDTLRRLGSQDAIELMSYYLDSYFDNYEEPQFQSCELKKAWYLLLIRGLIEEIARKGENKIKAKLKLGELVNVNSAWYENHYQKSGKEIHLKTLKSFYRQQETARERNEAIKEFKRQRRKDDQQSYLRGTTY